MKKKVTLAILVVSYLFAGLHSLVPSVVAQEDYTGTWVGSLYGEYTEGGIEAAIPDSFTVGFTMYLTITVDSGGLFVGRGRITVARVSWVETDPYIIVRKYCVSPVDGDVEITGFISSDKRLYCSPGKTVAYRITLDWSLILEGKEVPQPTDEWDGRTFTSVNCGISGYINVSIKRAWNIMRVSGSESWGMTRALCTGTLVLQKGAACISVLGDANILRNEKEEALVQGAEISSGDVIRTVGSGKVTLSLPDGSELKLDTDTSVEFVELLEAKTIKLGVLLGKIWLYVRSSAESLLPRDKFEVRTPVSSDSVRGTEFTVEVSENGTTTFIVLEGIVESSDPQQTKTVTVGQNQTSTSQLDDVPSDPILLDPSQIWRWWEESALMLMETDLNEDGAVNKVDIDIVARAFRTKPGDAGWNPFADLDGNDKVNIIDISRVAKDFGKTA